MQSAALPQPTLPPASAETVPGEVDIAALMRVLWRRKLVVVGTMLIGISLTLTILGFIQPRYAARSVVLVEGAAGATRLSPELENLVRTVRLDGSVMSNEVEVLRSRSMARLVLERLKPQSKDAQDSAGLKTFSLTAEQEESSDITSFLEHLKVRSLPGSNAIEIEYAALNPEKSALIANRVAEIYIAQRLESKAKTSRKLTGWLDRRLAELRAQVRESELAVQQYRQEFSIPEEGARGDIAAQQLSQLNAELMKSRADAAQVQARLSELQRLAKGGDAAVMAQTPLVASLKQDEAALMQKYSDLSARYGDKHPAILSLKAELADLHEKIKREAQSGIQTLRSEVSVARAREAALQAEIDALSVVQAGAGYDLVHLAELEREAESNRLIFETFLSTTKKSHEQEELQDAEARVLSYATPPLHPTYPNKMLLLSLAGALSLFLGLAGAFLVEKLDNTFRSAGQLERLGRYPCFALIPEVSGLKGAASADFILSKPSSSTAESVRTLRTVMNVRGLHGQKPKVVTITSALPGEGKSTLAGWLARAAAKAGEKVILIDADLRRPSLHKNFGQNNEVSLVEYLSGKAGLTDIIYKDKATGLHILFGKSLPGSALDMISSQKMADMMESLREAYDLVIIDSPACLAVSDARVLAKLSDQTLYMVGWDKTPRDTALSGVKQFADMGYASLAFVLGGVDVHRHVRYGYGDSVYYYGTS